VLNALILIIRIMLKIVRVYSYRVMTYFVKAKIISMELMGRVCKTHVVCFVKFQNDVMNELCA